MIRAIIFDYNRTIFIPEIGGVPKRTLLLLKELKNKGIKLGLISVNEKKRNLEPVLETFFTSVKIVPQKSSSIFSCMLDELEVSTDETVVVGDRVKEEIKYANQLGLKTVWLRKGKFAGELPDSTEEKPDITITDLRELKKETF